MTTEPLYNQPLVSPSAWAAGETWIRSRSGPRPRGNRGVEVSIWHKVRDLGGYERRIRTVCGFGPRDGFGWPAGGYRLEIARPSEYGGPLPGEICARCRSHPRSISFGDVNDELESVVDDDLIERLAELVTSRIVERIDEGKQR